MTQNNNNFEQDHQNQGFFNFTSSVGIPSIDYVLSDSSQSQIRQIVAIFPSMLAGKNPEPDEQGILFYLSTSSDLKMPNTWFPFYGVNDRPDEQAFSKLGSLFIPTTASKNIPSDIVSKFKECINKINIRKRNGNIPSVSGELSPQEMVRFDNLDGMIMSCWMGGGFWNEPEIKNEFVSFLKSHKDTQAFFKQISALPLIVKGQMIGGPTNENYDLKESMRQQNQELKICSYQQINEQFANLAKVKKPASSILNSRFPFRSPNLSESTIRIPGINFTSTDEEGDLTRQIVAIFPSMLVGKEPEPNEKAMLFYHSTGNNSKMGNTWFPFFGLNERDDMKGFSCLGGYLKPAMYTWNIPTDIDKELRNCLISINNRRVSEEPFVQGRISYDERGRFDTLDGMLISYWMGGGFWDEPEIKNEFVELLKKHDATKAFFENISVKPSVEITSNITLPRDSKIEDQKNIVKNTNDILAKLAHIKHDEHGIETISTSLSNIFERNKPKLRK